MTRTIFVYIDMPELQHDVLIGKLYTTAYPNKKEYFEFEYDGLWLLEGFHKCYKYIDPDLGLYAGVQYLKGKERAFILFRMPHPILGEGM